jgi:predicted YcjX-like family ATPase
MDVSLLDPFSARVVIELEFEDVNEALHDQATNFREGQAEAFRARLDELIAQLALINAQIDDIENDVYYDAQELIECSVASQKKVTQFTHRQCFSEALTITHSDN